MCLAAACIEKSRGEDSEEEKGTELNELQKLKRRKRWDYVREERLIELVMRETEGDKRCPQRKERLKIMRERQELWRRRGWWKRSKVWETEGDKRCGNWQIPRTAMETAEQREERLQSLWVRQRKKVSTETAIVQSCLNNL